MARWGTLGWIETGVKSLAFLCAYVRSGIVDHDRMVDPRGVRVAELVLVGIATVGLLAAIGDRLLEREIVAMVFVCFNNLAHLALLASLVTTAGPGHLLTAFAVLMTVRRARQDPVLALHRIHGSKHPDFDRDRTHRRLCARVRARRAGVGVAMIRPRPYEAGGWSSSHRRRSDGAIESTQRMVAPRPVVEHTVEGAMILGAAYWREVERLTRGLVRTRSRSERYGASRRTPRTDAPALRSRRSSTVTTDAVSTTYPIAGGMLARRAAGSITLSMHGGADGVELRSAIAGYHPTLAARPGAPAWTGELYDQIQARVHARVSRRYFHRLIDRVAP